MLRDKFAINWMFNPVRTGEADQVSVSFADANQNLVAT